MRSILLVFIPERGPSLAVAYQVKQLFPLLLPPQVLLSDLDLFLEQASEGNLFSSALGSDLERIMVLMKHSEV